MPVFEQDGVHVTAMGGRAREVYPSLRVDERGVKGLLDSDLELGADAAPDRERRLASLPTPPSVRSCGSRSPGAKPARARPDR